MSRQGDQTEVLQCERLLRLTRADKVDAGLPGWQLEDHHDSDDRTFKTRYRFDERNSGVCCPDWYNHQQTFKHQCSIVVLRAGVAEVVKKTVSYQTPKNCSNNCRDYRHGECSKLTNS